MVPVPKGLKSVPPLSWVGFMLWLAGLVGGWGQKPFVQEALATTAIAVGQLVFYVPLMLQAWHAGRAPRWAVILVVLLFVVSAVGLMLSVWYGWQAEQIMRRRGL